MWRDTYSSLKTHDLAYKMKYLQSLMKSSVISFISDAARYWNKLKSYHYKFILLKSITQVLHTYYISII